MEAEALERELARTHAALEAGRNDDAEAGLRRVISLQPDHGDALLLLGLMLTDQGRHAEAEPLFDQLCRQEPDDPAHWINLSNALRGAGHPDDALKALGRAAELGDRSVNFYFNAGLAHQARGDFEAARMVMGDALALDPEDVEIRHRYVQCCFDCLRIDLALEALQGWSPPADAPVEHVVGIAQVLMNAGEYQRSEAMLRQVLRGALAEPRTTLMLAQVLERTNRVDEADSLLRQLAARPDSALLGGELQRAMGRVAQRKGEHAVALELYQQALVEFGEQHERHHVLFNLAESLQALGRREESMETLHEAHASQAAFIERSRPLAGVRGIPQMRITEYRCDPADVAAWDHDGAPGVADSPVFVVAFPRSGTTLLELTLDAHPQLVSMDEQPFVQNALDDMIEAGARYPEALAGLGRGQLDAIRARYWERASRKATLAPGQRLVDKNPLNILRLPVIARLFPNAPIILAIRHPLDVILSCYCQHFRAPDFALMCADLPSLASGYRKTFDFWYDQAALLGPRIHELRYEALVGDFESGVRGLASFLELPWDAAMLDPAQRAHAKRFISTPSYSQVVQPVNRKSVDRWVAYAQWLQPLVPAVQPYIDRWGYTADGAVNSR